FLIYGLSVGTVQVVLAILLLALYSSNEVGTEAFNSEKKEGISENCSVILGEFRLISEGVAFVPAVYQFLSVEQNSKV
ncbi:hypothetical protein ACPTF6_13945, partial [Enterococcus faecalis]|uniref:hypothetical protein n=1 Tax=Enterococcus faecalis TaxID=1351 RepID=UPI003CC6803C